MVISIREATPKEFEVIYQFICELQNNIFDYEKMKSLYLENLENVNNIHLVAMDGRYTVGYLSCHIQTLLHHAGKVAEIQEMFVKPTYRSKGVGKLLMDSIKKLVAAKGVVQLEVTTRVIREKAIQFYRRENFEDSHKKMVHYFKLYHDMHSLY